MGFGGIGEGELVGNAQFQVAGLDPAEDGGGALFQFRPVGGVVAEAGAGEILGAVAEAARVNGRHRAAGLSVQGEAAARGEGCQAAVKGVLADGIVHRIEAGAVGGAGDFGGEVLLGVADDIVGAGVPGQVSLELGGDGGIDIGAQGFAHLDEEEAHAAGAGMHQHAVARLDAVGVVAEVVGGHSLEHCGGAIAGGEAGGHFDETPSGYGGQFGVGSGVAAVGYGVADGHIVHIGADLPHHAGGLNAGNPGQAGRVDAHTAVDVGEVDANGLDGDHRLAGAGGRVGQVGVAQHFGAAVLGNLDGFHFKRKLLATGWKGTDKVGNGAAYAVAPPPGRFGAGIAAIVAL